MNDEPQEAPQEDWLPKAMREADEWMRDDPRPLGTRPKYYHRDGTPFVFDPNIQVPEVIQWATEFERNERIVRLTRTLYGERLSTVYLGLDHNYSPAGPPIIFETMLFAPDTDSIRRRSIQSLADEAVGRKVSDPQAKADYDRFHANLEKNFPHDQLQLRYSTEAEAIESHQKLRLQCLIPPRWRRLLCYTIGGDATWE